MNLFPKITSLVMLFAFAACHDGEPDPAIAVDWTLFYKAMDWQNRDGEWTPVFDDEIKKLHGQRITIVGFMIPLQAETKQKHFILSATSGGCDFCSSGGIGSHMEVYSIRAIRYTVEPIQVTGIFRLHEQDENGRFFRITAAQAAPLIF